MSASDSVRTGSGKAYDRAATEARLIAATYTILKRDGILAGLNLREVAQEASVNRGLIYQYFGSRRDLLRSALGAHLTNLRKLRQESRDLPFSTRRRRVFELMLGQRDFAQFESLLALDGDEDLRVIVDLDTALADIENDKASAFIPPDFDGLALQVITTATFTGYCVLREAFARTAEVDSTDLDERVLNTFEKLLESMSLARQTHSD